MRYSLFHSRRTILRLPSQRFLHAFTSRRSLLTLAIETSCDDTAVAILQRDGATGSPANLLFNERLSSDNRAFLGINPSVAARGHEISLGPMIQQALESLPDVASGSGEQRFVWTASEARKKMPDFVAVTRGPGIRLNLTLGLNFAKGLAAAWGIPLVGVHHMQAHALTPRLAAALATASKAKDFGGNELPSWQPAFPFLSLLVSGGHTQLLHSTSLVDHKIIATTTDNAIGNVLDQTARVILPAEMIATSKDVSYGRVLESFAFPSDQTPEENYAFFQPAKSRQDETLASPGMQTGYDWSITQPFRQTRKLAYSFAGIYSQAHRIAATNPDMSLPERRALARCTMTAAFQHLVGRLCIALEDRPELRAARTIVLAGGVASNQFLRHVVRSTLDARELAKDVEIAVPPVALCTDNAAMIAWAGMEMFEAGYHTDLSVGAIPKWPMDPELGDGILGVSGWMQK